MDVTTLELPADPQVLQGIVRSQAMALSGLTREKECRDRELGRQQSDLAAKDLLLQSIRQQTQDLQAQVIRQAQEQAQQAKLLDQVKEEAARQIEALKQKHQAEMQALLRRFYGPKSERFDPCQLLLFGAMMESAEVVPQPQAAEVVPARPGVVRKGIRDQHGREKLPESLPRMRVIHDLPESQRQGLVKIGEVITEQLEYLAGGFYVLQHVQRKYGLPAQQQIDDAGIVLAPKPAQPIEKGLAGPGLLAYIITSKLADHLPLYRLEGIFARQGMEIARGTMCSWMGACGDLVKPLVDLMADQVRQSRVIHTDDTRIPVQDEGRCYSGRIWGYLGDQDHPYTVYDYTPDRSRDGPHHWLKDYQGYLQADAYGGYNGVYLKGLIIEVACWAHARRKFFDAFQTDTVRCGTMLKLIGELYQVERQADEAGLDEPALLALRQARSVAILAKIKAYLDEQAKIVLPRSAVALAINYCLNQWDALCVYATKGFLAIDNNAAERAMKPIAIGRKNWLFAGNDESAIRTARLMTLIESAKRHGLNVQRYLSSVLAKIAQTPLSELAQFLPEVWKRDDVAEPWPKLPPPAAPSG